MHTWHGMLGYCLKDLHMPHCKVVSKEVSDEDREIGAERYVLYGADIMKNRIALDMFNFFPRLHMFAKFSPGRDLGEGLQRTVLRMLRSGKYYPAAKWVVPITGHGMALGRAEACWKMMVQPEKINWHDVEMVFFRDFTEGRYFARGQPLGPVSAWRETAMPACSSPLVPVEEGAEFIPM